MIPILHYLKDPKVGGIMVYSLLWVMQDLYHQPYWVLRLEFEGARGRRESWAQRGSRFVSGMLLEGWGTSFRVRNELFPIRIP